MFCPNCGKSDQTENSYCRQCGEFLVGSKSLGALSFGGITPRQNVNSITVLSLIAAIFSLFAAGWMYLTDFNIPFVLYFGATVLICNALWHFSNIYTARKLASKISGKTNRDDGSQAEIPAAKTRELLEPADMSDHVPASVTENTTRHLSKTARPDTSKLD